MHDLSVSQINVSEKNQIGGKRERETESQQVTDPEKKKGGKRYNKYLRTEH